MECVARVRGRWRVAWAGWMCALLGGCRAAPISYVAVIPQTQIDSYACALRMVNEHGFTVTNTSRDPGFITAERHRGGTMQWLVGRDDVDRLTVSIFEDTIPRQHKLRVTVSAGRTYQSASGTRTSSIAPSANANDAAKALTSACTLGASIRQTGMPLIHGQRIVLSKSFRPIRR